MHDLSFCLVKEQGIVRQYVYASEMMVRMVGHALGFQPEAVPRPVCRGHSVVVVAARQGTVPVSQMPSRQSVEAVLPEGAWCMMSFRSMTRCERYALMDEGVQDPLMVVCCRIGGVSHRQAVDCAHHLAALLWTDSHVSSLWVWWTLLMLIVKACDFLLWWCHAPLLFLLSGLSFLTAGVIFRVLIQRYPWWWMTRPAPRHYWRRGLSCCVFPLSWCVLCQPSRTASSVSVTHGIVPLPLREAPLCLGVDPLGQSAGLMPDQLHSGVAIVGQAGTGKTVLMHGVIEWLMSHRTDSQNMDWSAQSVIIDFEMKDESGVTCLDRYAKKHQLRTPRHTIRLTDPSSYQIDLLDYWSGLPAKKCASQTAGRLQAAFDAGDIQGRSVEVLAAALTCGIFCYRYESQHPSALLTVARSWDMRFPGARFLSSCTSPMEWAWVCLGGGSAGLNGARAVALSIAGCQDTCTGFLSQDAYDAQEAATQLYGVVEASGRFKNSDAQVMQLTIAARNKVTQLLECPWLWDPQRACVRWESLVRTPGDYRLVCAPSEEVSLPSYMEHVCGALLVQSLWATIRSTCRGWQDHHRYVCVACDEMSMLAGSDPSVLVALREQGRSFGVILLMATQYPDQLPSVLKGSFLGYGTVCAYSTNDAPTARLVAERLSDTGDGSDGWSMQTIENLPRWTMAVRTRTAYQAQPAFLIHVRNFDDL